MDTVKKLLQEIRRERIISIYFMSTAHHTPHVIPFTRPKQSFWVGTISSFLQLSELRLREIKYHT